ncbi:MAG TPA: GNAT family N-acetyltransferase [Thermomicrobiales bacterium]|jgi:predicted GNAT family N-acyltransferase|nr:GNAT family N-acetyltransferase [Thermomicrobiales bacterium]
MPSLAEFWRHLTGDEDRDMPDEDDARDVDDDAVVARPVESDADWAAVQVVRRMVFHDEQGFIGAETTDSDDGRSFQALATVPITDAAMGDRWAELRVGDRLVVSVGRMTPGPASGSEATITWVATVPDFRGRGAAAAVMGLMLQQADRIGAPTVRLSSQGHAVPFYRRLGFQPVGAPYEIRGMPHQLMARWQTS